MSEVFGYAVANKVTGKRAPTSRCVYDSKSAASGALTRLKKQMKMYPDWYPDTVVEELHVVSLVAAKDE